MDATVARLRRWGASGAHFGIIIGFTVFAAFPFFWMLITTFKETRDLLKGTSKNALMSPNRGSGRHPASGFWHSVAPERLM